MPVLMSLAATVAASHAFAAAVAVPHAFAASVTGAIAGATAVVAFSIAVFIDEIFAWGTFNFGFVIVADAVLVGVNEFSGSLDF